MANLVISSEKQNIINQYLDEILEVNKSINLTRIIDRQQAELLHLEDSLSVIEEINSAPDGLYGDLGSGGGFPGVPLGIMTERKTILIDSVKKKMAAVDLILKKMNIDNISTYDGRIEELSNTGKKFSVLTARALSSLPALLELSSPLLINDGLLICLKSHVDENEIKQAKHLEDKLGLKLIKQRDYVLSDMETYRSVYVFKKIHEAKIKLPRRNGLAQKKPLIH